MIRVLLADDENLIRSALAALLALEEDLEVVAQAASGAEALAMARAYTPDVAVLDLQMPDRDGISVAGELAEALPGCGVVIVTGHGHVILADEACDPSPYLKAPKLRKYMGVQDDLAAAHLDTR